ncbi:MAG: tRNA pseudouridine(55) synthase TruB [Desulfobulbaceae bacterium]|nr:tRNA pseudouridine(55) synthase TruB [Desulfobulbaceae bacterium]
MEVCQPEGRSRSNFTAGVFLVDKPPGATSFSMVRHVRRLLDIKKVGHAGTLDPFATGLLIICAGRPATRLVDRFMEGEKVYTAVLQLGVETETMDTEGKVVRTAEVPRLSRKDIEGCLGGFTGRVMQVPPPYSAVKYKGKPLYHYARKGVEVIKEPREIEIFSLAFGSYDDKRHRLEIEVTCSRGTYIRVLASDIGMKLGCGAHLTALRRLASGRFFVQNSLPGDNLSGPDGREELMKSMISVDQALAMLDEQVNMPL